MQCRTQVDFAHRLLSAHKRAHVIHGLLADSNALRHPIPLAVLVALFLRIAPQAFGNGPIVRLKGGEGTGLGERRARPCIVPTCPGVPLGGTVFAFCTEMIRS